MWAAQIVEPGSVTMERVRLPSPGRHDVRLRIEGSGVCASNLGPWRGLPWLRYPMEPGGGGHEAWGIIDEVGDGVDRALLGKRVTALCHHAYAEYDVAQADTVVPLPAALDGAPFPGEAFGCAMNIFRRSGIDAGDTVAIVGVGFLGAILVRLSKRAGAKVIALSRRPFALEAARRAGADELVPMDDHARVLDAVTTRTEGRLCDRVIEATGAPWPLDLAAEITRERGTLVIAGYHQDGPRQVNMQLWNWRGLDVVNAHERDPLAYVRGMREATEAVAAGTLDVASYVTHRFPLQQLGRALDATDARPEGFLKAVVVP
jgi:threonine dehydrogenase-like Zn-dependent dehydrogenase